MGRGARNSRGCLNLGTHRGKFGDEAEDPLPGGCGRFLLGGGGLLLGGGRFLGLLRDGVRAFIFSTP